MLVAAEQCSPDCIWCSLAAHNGCPDCVGDWLCLFCAAYLEVDPDVVDEYHQELIEAGVLVLSESDGEDDDVGDTDEEEASDGNETDASFGTEDSLVDDGDTTSSAFSFVGSDLGDAEGEHVGLGGEGEFEEGADDTENGEGELKEDSDGDKALSAEARAKKPRFE